METTDPSRQPILRALDRAGALHSRQRATAFLLRSLLWLVAAIPALMVADVLFHFSGNLRLAGTAAIVLAGVGLVVAAACMAIFVRPPVLRIARLLEARNPALGSKLVNILQLDADAADPSAAPLTRDLARRAVADAGKSLDLGALPPLAREPALPRYFRNTAVAAGVLLLVSVFGGSHVHSEWLRFLDPYGDHPPFSLTRLEILKPVAGEQVLYGGSVVVETRASGHQPRELFLTAGAGGSPLTLPMVARGDGTFIARLENIVQPVELTAHTGNGGSRSQRRLLGVILTPSIGPALARVTPPEYTGLKPRETPWRFTAMQVLEGSEVQFQIESNRPLGAGEVMLETSDPAPRKFPLTPAPEGPAEVALADLVAAESGRLSFSVVDAAGNTASETPTATLTVTRDLAPAIAISTPDADALVVENLAIPVKVDATDDYGLRSVRLHIGINERFLPVVAVAFDAPDTRRHRLEHTLDLAALGARPGDVVTLFAETLDTRPDPQITRTSTRRMEVITEDDYNDRLREKADVAMIAGKYERLLDRFESQIQEQKEIGRKLAEARAEKDPERQLEALSEAYAEQERLNERLEQLADEMKDFGRDKPVYDFEKDLHERLAQQAEAIQQSVAENREANEKALESGPPPPAAPTPEMMQNMEQAAREQAERLQGGNEGMAGEVLEPLQDLARLHELMKDFKRFEQLAQEQREIAGQSKAYGDKPELNAEDRLAMREMGARQREMAQKLEQLAEKLRHDADAAEEKFPEAASSAKQLADQMDAAAMPDLARRAARGMVESKAAESHAQARHLQEEMDRLFSDEAQAGQNGVAQGFDRTLQLSRGMNPGDSLRQMLLSQNFRALPAEGGAGAGAGGEMSSMAMDAQALLLGGETLMDGPIAESLAGRGDGGGAGQPGAPTARLDRPDEANVDRRTARRTNTPGSGALLPEYENIADAYFRRLTTKP